MLLKKILEITSLLSVILIVLGCESGTPIGATQFEVVDSVTDFDGNTYYGIKIGDQVWTTTNLKTVHYNDGTSINNLKDSLEWKNTTSGAHCFYNNDSTISKDRYGVIYNYLAIETNKLAPKGWHIPTKKEWIELQNTLILEGHNHDGRRDTTVENSLAKSLASQHYWEENIMEAAPGNESDSNNTSGFDAIPGGIRFPAGIFYNEMKQACFWSSSINENISENAIQFTIIYGNASLIESSLNSLNSGAYIRLVRD